MTNTVSKSKDVNEFEEVDKLIDKHTRNLTKTGDKDFNPPEIVSFDVRVVNTYELQKDFVKLLSEAEKRGEERERERIKEQIHEEPVILVDIRIDSSQPHQYAHAILYERVKEIIDSLIHQKG